MGIRVPYGDWNHRNSWSCLSTNLWFLCGREDASLKQTAPDWQRSSGHSLGGRRHISRSLRKLATCWRLLQTLQMHSQLPSLRLKELPLQRHCKTLASSGCLLSNVLWFCPGGCNLLFPSRLECCWMNLPKAHFWYLPCGLFWGVPVFPGVELWLFCTVGVRVSCAVRGRSSE